MNDRECCSRSSELPLFDRSHISSYSRSVVTLSLACTSILYIDPKRYLYRFSCFCTAHGRESLYFTIGRPFSLKIAPLHEGSVPPSNTWCFWPTGVHNLNGTSICSAIFAGLTTMTDRQTDRPRCCVCNSRAHLCITAMWPKVLNTWVKFTIQMNTRNNYNKTVYSLAPVIYTEYNILFYTQ